MRRLIAVCGSDGSDPNLSSFALQTAEYVGREIAKSGSILVCGGRGGVMRAACKGAKDESGITVGLLPTSKQEANEYVDIPLLTGLGNRRNFLVVSAADVVIAIAGRWGTLNEISYAMIFGIPVVLIQGTGGCVDELISGKLMKNLAAPYFIVSSAQEAVEKAVIITQK